MVKKIQSYRRAANSDKSNYVTLVSIYYTQEKLHLMLLSKELARHIREIHFGTNWTWANMQEHLKDVDYKAATTAVKDCNTIALLVFHMNYYLNAVSNRVAGNPLTGKHEDSFKVPAIETEDAWQAMLSKTWQDAESFAALVENLSEAQLWENINERYGTVYRNIQGVIEHNHYHLGQIVVLKKLITTL